MGRYPYMNRGSYEWVPDTYAATSGADFGVTQAYYPACIDYGRPKNMFARELGGTLLVSGVALRDKAGKEINSLGTATGDLIGGPFLQTLMRVRSENFNDLPDGDPVGMSSFDIDKGPFYLFDFGNSPQRPSMKIPSLLIDYKLYTSDGFAVGEAPLSIYALFDKDEVGAWYTLSRSDGKTTWGPPAEETPVSNATVTAAATLLGHPVTALHIPIPFRDANNPDHNTNRISLPEFQPSDPAAYSKDITGADRQPWDPSNPRQVSIRLSPRYFVSSDNFPRLRGILIAPHETIGTKAPWNALINKIRIYDAIQTNVTPEHDETSGDQTITVKPQFPCKIFGYAWRLSHSVQMSKNTLPIQPSFGTTLSDTPGNAKRSGTFKFKLYHPDFPKLGLAHSVRFYYGLAVAAMPGTSPLVAGAISLGGLLFGMVSDTDLLLVQYMGPLVGHQSLTFIPAEAQKGLPPSPEAPGRVVWGGQFGYSRQTVGLKCLEAKLAGDTPPTQPPTGSPPTSLWTDIMRPDSGGGVGASVLPEADVTGLGPLYYHDKGTTASWYTFLSMDASGITSWNPDIPSSYVGGFTIPVRGTPQSHVNGIGAFSMAISDSETFGGGEVTSIYAKAKNMAAAPASVVSYCTNNMDSHVATFVSEARNIGSEFQVFVGDWIINFVASVSDTSRDNTQLFYRFALVSSNVSDTELNGEMLWTHGPDKVQEFHFEPDTTSGGYAIAKGPPGLQNVISTVYLSEEPTAYPTTITCLRAHGPLIENGGMFEWDGNIDLQESHINGVLQGWDGGGVRVAIQVWAISYAKPGAAVRDPRTATQYPTVQFSWGGDTESQFQTMITETRSGEILANKDPVVAGYTTTTANLVTMLVGADDPNTTPPTATHPYRDYPLYNQRLTLGNRFDTGSSRNERLPEAAILSSDMEMVPGLSLLNIKPKSYYDSMDDAAQVADTYLVITGPNGDTGIDAIIGGTNITPQTMTITGNITNNVSTFNAVVSFELYVVNEEKSIAYAIFRSGGYRINGTSGKPLEPSPTESFTLTATVPQAIAIPGEGQLMLRCKVWSYFNSNSAAAKDSTLNVNPDKMYIDIGEFKVSMSVGLSVITNESYIIGKEDWYQGLPVSSSRTFGAANYFFVADETTSKGPQIRCPNTVSQYDDFVCAGWMFSPFWFIDMPEGGAFEIVDLRGLTLPSTGSGFLSPERESRVLYTRTAIDTVPSTSVSSTRGGGRFGPRDFIARAGLDSAAVGSAGAPLGVISIQDSNLLKGLVEFLVRSGENIVTGKNPLIVALDPDAAYTSHLRLRYGKMNPHMRMLLYEEDTFDSDRHQSSIGMLMNYDGSGVGWQNPYGSGNSGSTDKVIMTNDMQMLGAAVDPQSFNVYVVGYRNTDPTNPQDGGMIVMRNIRPPLIFGSDSAATGPLHYVDGTLTEESWNTSAILQPMFPRNATNDPQGTLDAAAVIKQRPNAWGYGGATAPASNSFPDVFVDGLCNVYVFYTLMSDPKTNASEWGTIGRIFCRRSCNAGYYFEPPFPVVDLGYRAANMRQVFGSAAEDDTFDIKHIVSLYDDRNKVYLLFFWAGGKVFMRIAPHPGIPADRVASDYSSSFSESNIGEKWSPGHRIYMVAGSTDFIETKPSTRLDRWLEWQFSTDAGGSEATDVSGAYIGWNDPWSGDTKKNNYRAVEGQPGPLILINRYTSDPDVPPQRISALVTLENDIIIVFMDALYQLNYKRIRIGGPYPIITPAVILDTNVL